MFVNVCNNNNNKVAPSSLINKAESYVNDIDELINDVEELQDPKRRKQKPRKIDISREVGTGVENDNNGNDMWFPPKKGNSKRVVSENTQRWPAGTIWYRFKQGHFSEHQRNMIREVIRYFNAKFNCGQRKWEEDVNGDKGYHVRFEDAYQSGCGSIVGYDGTFGYDFQSIYLSEGCLSYDTILHLMMHTMGFAHEHNRSDRDKFVKINWPNIESGYERNFEVVRQAPSEPLPSTYDYRSIMNYPSKAFARDPNKNTITVLNGGEIDYWRTHLLGQATSLSVHDVEMLRHYYQCDN